MRYYVHYLHFLDYFPHLCRYVYYNVSAVVRPDLLLVVGMSNLNKGLSSTFQPPEEGRGVQRPKRYDKHGDKNEDNSPKNVDNIYIYIYIYIYMCVCVCVYLPSPTHGQDVTQSQFLRGV